MNTDKIIVIANPISGYGKVGFRLEDAVAVLKKTGKPVKTLITEYGGHAGEIAAETGNALIIVFGGDGTFNEVLNAVDLQKTALAIIPAGTGNVLAKELKMPLNPTQAARSIIHGEFIQCDVGIANNRRFACFCGAGLGAYIVKYVHDKRDGNLTQLHYLPPLIQNCLSPPRWDIRVKSDGVVISEKDNLVTVGNTSSYGGLMKLTPEADMADGMLDVTAMKLNSPLDMLIPGIAALTRGLANCEYVHNNRGKNISLTAPHDEVPYQIDGDFAGYLPVSISIDAQRLNLVNPHPRYDRDILLPI